MQMRDTPSHAGAMAVFLGIVCVSWPTLMVVTERARLLTVYVLLVLGLITIVRFGWNWRDPVARLLLAGIGAACVTGLVALLGSDGLNATSWRLYDAAYSPLLFVLPIFFLFQHYRPNTEWLWWGGVLGAGAAGVHALMEIHRAFPDAPFFTAVLAGSSFRVTGGTNAVVFGMQSAILVLFSLGAIVHFRRTSLVSRAIWALATLMGLLACISTGSRGAWVGIVVALIAALAVFWNMLSSRAKVAIPAFMIIGMLVIGKLPFVQARLGAAVTDIQTYHENAGTSLGLRFELWRAAVITSTEHPMFGLGYGERAFKEAVVDLSQRKLIAAETVEYSHAHNDFLQALATRGYPAALALMAALLVFPWLFVRALRQGDPQIRHVATLGLMISAAFVAFGLSDIALLHRPVIAPYTVLMAVLLGLSYPANSESAEAVAFEPCQQSVESNESKAA